MKHSRSWPSRRAGGVLRGRGIWLRVAALALGLAVPGVTAAHFCSDIFRAHSKLVVQPETTTVTVGSSGATLRVYLQNNYPYRLKYTEMQGSATGYTVTVSPGPVDVYPGQKAAFIFSISGPSGSLLTSTLNLQVRFRDDRYTAYPPNGVGPWKGMTDYLVAQNPSFSSLTSSLSSNTRDSSSLILSTIADKHGTTALPSTEPYFGRTGIQHLIHMFGYRFCYNTDGAWRCPGQDCPSPCAEGSPWTADWQFPNNCMRAGAEVAVRIALLGNDLTAAQAGAVNAMKAGGGNAHKCLAAIVGGYLFQSASSTTAFTTALQSTTNAVPQACQNAGLRVLNGSNASSCTSGQFYELAACAAAEGLRGNDGPVNSVLKPNAGDNCSPNCTTATEPSLFYAYMLYIVAKHRARVSGYVSFYPDAGASSCTLASDCNDGNVCTTDSCSGGVCQHTTISGCCTTSSQCNDNNACTTDTCNTTSNTCSNTTITGCCTTSSQCNDNNVCTSDTCSSTSHTCSNTTITGCCTSASQCSDGNACTTDTCSTTTNTCTHTAITGCCTTNAQCADNDACTTDTCNTTNGTCSNVKQSGCCSYDTDCDDSNACTLDKCNTTSHTCTHTNVACGDGGGGVSDSGARRDGGARVDRGKASFDLGSSTDAGEVNMMEGGCAVGGGAHRAPVLLGLALLAALGLARRRSRGRRR